MIWYLLYPLRGTTEAPTLAPSHPLRHALARYGTYAARHVVTTLLVSVAVATILIYPIPFLFTTDFTNGASNLPHHAWTGARPLSRSASIEPDVIMRSIWVHSGYMEALDKRLLASALELQDELLGSTRDFDPRHGTQDSASLSSPGPDMSPMQRDAFHAINGLTNQSWFFHSPLLYWGCSHERILEDADIVATVNDKKNQLTPANLTLRHSIVFSGKRFEDRRLLAADALVITLIHLLESPVGKQWERNAAILSQKVSDKWDIYPSNGRSWGNQLYEFQFRPISNKDSFFLSLAYALTLMYFLLSLSKLRAVKSKFGLIVTVMTQIILSVMSSFTVCAIFKIDLSRIPSAAYPLVVLAMSLENIFRLINAVILTPSEDSTSSRIGFAFGETANTALTSSTQNVLLLLGLSRLVSPGVSAFCIFAAIAIIFDFFYLSTFFLSVLSVDVRRTELGDALARASMRHNRRPSELRLQKSWMDDILQGKIAISTRIAGTAVMLGFVSIAQWHFFEDGTVLRFLARLYRGSRDTGSASSPRAQTLEVIHQARSPTSWLRLQDHETANEVINIIKPSAHSYIAKVYEPLVFVLKDADRKPSSKEPTLLPAAYDFVHHQFAQFVITVFVVVAAVRLLTSYLLWEDEFDDNDDDERHLDEGRLSVNSFAGGHALDIAMLTASSDGHVASVGLDRRVRIWNMRSRDLGYVISDDGDAHEILFPVLAMAIDQESRWLAILSTSRTALWDLSERIWGPTTPVDLGGQKPEAFFFSGKLGPEERIPRLSIARRNGILTELLPDMGQGNDFGICRSPLICVRPMIEKCASPSESRVFIITSSRRGCVHMATRTRSSWNSTGLKMAELQSHDVHQVVPLPSLGLFLVAAPSHVHVIKLENHAIVHTFETEPMQPKSLQCTFSQSPPCQASYQGLRSFTLCYLAVQTGDCVLQTSVPPEGEEFICYDSSAVSTRAGWCSWITARDMKQHIRNPGSWSVLADNNIVGVRRKLPPGNIMSDGDGRRTADGLRHRSPRKGNGGDVFGCWEVWTVSPGMRERPEETRPLFQTGDKSGHLVVSELGPFIRVGQRSAAFGFGNVMKLVTVGGQERFETSQGELGNVGGRRRKARS